MVNVLTQGVSNFSNGFINPSMEVELEKGLSEAIKITLGN
jgi:hypothetical protein